MARWVLAVSAALVAAIGAPAHAQAGRSAVATHPVQFDGVPFATVANSVLRRVLREPFVLCDAVLKDERKVSMRLMPYQLNIDTISRVFTAHGYSVRRSGGVVYVCDGEPGGGGNAGAGSVSVARADPVSAGPAVAGSGGVPGGRPVDAVAPAPVDRAPPAAEGEAPIGGIKFVPVMTELRSIRVANVDAAQLVEVVRPLFPDLVVSVAKLPGHPATMFAQGEPELVDRLSQMIRFLDRPADSVEIQAIVVEVTRGERDGFGVTAVLNALADQTGVTLTVPGERAGVTLGFRSETFEAVLSAVADQTQARVVSAPRVRGRFGDRLRFQVGQNVPTLGVVVETPGGSYQQSVEYRESGVIFEVLPSTLGERIVLDLHQELSQFIQTESGVQGSPTLQTRELDTVLELEPGEWAVVGGLSTRSEQRQRQSLLGLIPIGRQANEQAAELVLLVTAQRLSRAAPGAGLPGTSGESSN